MAFQDLNFCPESVRSTPSVPLWYTAWGWLITATARAGISGTAGFDMHRILVDAGLPAPTIRAESIVESGPDAASYAWLTDALRSMLQLIEQFGGATSAPVPPASLSPVAMTG
jgi:hypothetical protein